MEEKKVNHGGHGDCRTNGKAAAGGTDFYPLHFLAALFSCNAKRRRTRVPTLVLFLSFFLSFFFSLWPLFSFWTQTLERLKQTGEKNSELCGSIARPTSRRVGKSKKKKKKEE